MQGKNNAQVNLVDIFLFLLSRWWVFLLCALLCMGFAYYRYSKKPFYYRGAATVMIKKPADTRSSTLGNYSSLVNSVNITYEKMQFHSKELMRRVVLALDADIDYLLDIKLRDVELYDRSPVRMMLIRSGNEDPAPFTVQVSPQSGTHIQLTWNGTSRRVALGDTLSLDGRKMVFFPTPTYTGYLGGEVKIVKNSLMGAVGRYLGNLQTEQFSTSTSMLSISLTDRSAQRACDIVNMLVEKYNEESILEKNRSALNTAGFINERIIAIQKELSGIEDEMVRFKQEEKMTSPYASAEEFLSAGRSYNQQIVQIEMQERLSAYLKDYLYTAFQEYITVPANIGISEASINAAIAEYNTLILQRSRLVEASSEASPVVRQLEDDIKPMRQNIMDRIANFETSLSFKKADLAEQERMALINFTAIPAKSQDLLNIERRSRDVCHRVVGNHKLMGHAGRVVFAVRVGNHPLQKRRFFSAKRLAANGAAVFRVVVGLVFAGVKHNGPKPAGAQGVIGFAVYRRNIVAELFGISAAQIVVAAHANNRDAAVRNRLRQAIDRVDIRQPVGGVHNVAVEHQQINLFAERRGGPDRVGRPAVGVRNVIDVDVFLQHGMKRIIQAFLGRKTAEIGFALDQRRNDHRILLRLVQHRLRHRHAVDPCSCPDHTVRMVKKPFPVDFNGHRAVGADAQKNLIIAPGNEHSRIKQHQSFCHSRLTPFRLFHAAYCSILPAFLQSCTNNSKMVLDFSIKE